MVLSWVLAYGVGVAADLDAPEFAATLGAALTDGPLAGMIYGTPHSPTDKQRSTTPEPNSAPIATTPHTRPASPCRTSRSSSTPSPSSIG